MATEKEFTRKLFNKSARRLDHDRGSLHPQTAGAFTNAEADKLLRLYKNELIDMDNVTVESLTNDGVKQAQTEASKHEAEIAKRLADAYVLRQQKAYEEAIAGGLTDSEARIIADLPPAPGAEADEKAAS